MLNKIYFKLVNKKFSKIAEMPKVIRIENTNFCNSKCTFCPHSKMKRKKGFMNKETFYNAIDIAVNEGIEEVHLQNFGEPLMDINISNKIKLCKIYKIKKVAVFTNASLLTKIVSEELIDSGLDEITLSFEGLSKEIYNKIRIGLDYDITAKNIKNLYKIRGDGLKPKIIIQVVDQFKIKKLKKKFLKDWNKYCDSISFQTLHNWTLDKNKRHENKFCKIPWSYITVLWNGDVVFCCLDYEGKAVMGNVNIQNFQKIWNGKEYKRVRKLLLDNKMKNINLCSKCSLPNNPKWNRAQLK